MIYKYFEKRYKLGELALIEAITIKSLDFKEIKPLSLMVISPSGTLKSTITKQIVSLFPNVLFIHSRFTPYGLSKLNQKKSLNNMSWIINDMVRTFSGQPATKIAETVGWLTELMSEGHAGSDTANEAEITARMNIIGNIAVTAYKDLQRKFIETTFAERILQYSYGIDKNYIRNAKNDPLPKIRLKKVAYFKLTPKEKKAIYNLGDKLTTLGQYETQSMRPDEMVKAFLYGHATLKTHNYIKKSDYILFDSLIQKFRRVM